MKKVYKVGDVVHAEVFPMGECIVEITSADNEYGFFNGHIISDKVLSSEERKYNWHFKRDEIIQLIK